MKTRITAAVLGLVMLSMTTAPCGTIAGGAIGAGTGAAVGEQEPATVLKKMR